jgi:MoaA/NifB/PqqE/SkfB family radical SAM enzyme
MKFNKFWRYRRIILSRQFAVALWRARQNVISATLGNRPADGPHMAELDVTYQCNCRCQMCQRWQNSSAGELTLTEYQDLAEVFRHMGVHLVTIGGGEPLLRKDISTIIETFAKRGMSVNLCTNGILLKRYAKSLCTSGASCVTISLDGATASCHEEIRGAPGSYSQIQEGIRSILRYSPARRPLIRVRMTISNKNLHEVRPYYQKWRRTVDDVLLQPVHCSHNSYYTGMESEDLCIDPDKLAENLNGTHFERSVYMRRLLKSLRQDGTFPRHRCYAGVLMVRIDPWGNVFPCLEQHKRVGSLREQDFPTIWNSELFDLERKQIASNANCTCWYNNTAMISHYGKLLCYTSAKGLSDGVRNLMKRDHKVLCQEST